MTALLPAQASNLPASVRHYVENALSATTRLAYKNDMTHYRAWGGSIPSSPEQVAAYLTAHAEIHAIATLQRRLVSISKAHTMKGYADPVKSDLVKLTMRGIRHIHGKPQAQVSPILKDDLIVMLSHIPDTIKGKRDRALLLLGFCGALRRSELVAVKLEDVEISSQGITLTLPRSKTDQNGHGRKIGIPYGRSRICPVEAVQGWLTYRGAASGYIFCSVSKGGAVGDIALTGRAVADIIKHYCKKAGLDASRYSGHSLRSGLCTSAAQQGFSAFAIKKQTGHKSDAMLARYIRDGNLFTDNAASLF